MSNYSFQRAQQAYENQEPPENEDDGLECEACDGSGSNEDGSICEDCKGEGYVLPPEPDYDDQSNCE